MNTLSGDDYQGLAPTLDVACDRCTRPTDPTRLTLSYLCLSL